MTASQHTPGPWEANGLVIQAKDINRTCDSCGVTIHEDDPNPRCIYCGAHTSPQYINIAKTAFNFCPDAQLDPEWAEGAPLEAEATANARLLASAPAMLDTIETVGRIVGQILDNPKMTLNQRSIALSEASNALAIFYKITGRPLKWWNYEPAIAKATGEVSSNGNGYQGSRLP